MLPLGIRDMVNDLKIKYRVECIITVSQFCSVLLFKNNVLAMGISFSHCNQSWVKFCSNNFLGRKICINYPRTSPACRWLQTIQVRQIEIEIFLATMSTRHVRKSFEREGKNWKIALQSSV